MNRGSGNSLSASRGASSLAMTSNKRMLAAQNGSIGAAAVIWGGLYQKTKSMV